MLVYFLFHNVAYSGKDILNCTAEEFAKGSKSFIIVTENYTDYTVVFASESEEPVYTYIGIDAEPFNDAAPSETLCSSEDLTGIAVKPAEPASNYSVDELVYRTRALPKTVTSKI